MCEEFDLSDPWTSVRCLAVKGARLADFADLQSEKFSDALRQRERGPDPADIPISPADASRALKLLMRAADRALTCVAGAGSTAAVDRRAAELEATELGRMQGRLAMSLDGVDGGGGAFDSEALRRATALFVASLDSGLASPGYAAYCRWRAYVEALADQGEEARARFGAALGEALLGALPGGSVPAPLDGGRRDAAAVQAGLEALLGGCKDVGLLTSWSLNLDEVDAELWGEARIQSLSVSAVVYGSPFVLPQVLLAEQGSLVPDSVAAVVDAWCKRSGPSMSSSVERFYIDTRYNADSTSFEPKQVQLLVRLG